jgi:hypothetical protein
MTTATKIRLRNTSMTVENWKSLFDVLAVVLLGLTFFAGAGVLFTGNIINSRQSKQLREFDVDITKAKSDLAKQQERAAKAESSIALAEQHSSEANAKAEGFRADIAKANASAAQAEAQVAAATAEAAVAKLETEKLKEVVTWRTIPSENAAALEKVLSGKPGGVNLRYTDGDPESLFLAIQISQILGKAKWKVAPGAEKFANAIQFGIALPDSAGADAQTLRSAFNTAKVPFTTGQLPESGVGFSVSTIPGAPTLMIGSRAPVIP